MNHTQSINIQQWRELHGLTQAQLIPGDRADREMPSIYSDEAKRFGFNKTRYAAEIAAGKTK